MISRVVEISSPAYLSYKDKQLLIAREGEKDARVPIEDLGVLLIDNPQIAITIPLLQACAESNVAVIVCDSKHIPLALLSPFEANTLHTKTLREQISAPLVKKKRLWQKIVQEKIKEQSSLLKELFNHDDDIGKLKAFVRSGDPDNVEARAARTYFLKLFGDGFVREREEPGVNSMLNYGYAVVRSAVARAVTSTGLHPALGIHHRNQYNAFALADDLVEPLRPMVDAFVFQVKNELGEITELDSQVKRQLLQVLAQDVQWDNRRYPLMTALGLYASNFKDCLLGRGRILKCPSR